MNALVVGRSGPEDGGEDLGPLVGEGTDGNGVPLAVGSGVLVVSPGPSAAGEAAAGHGEEGGLALALHGHCDCLASALVHAARESLRRLGKKPKTYPISAINPVEASLCFPCRCAILRTEVPVR